MTPLQSDKQCIHKHQTDSEHIKADHMIEVRRMCLGDAHEAATIGEEAFRKDEVFTWLFPGYKQYPSEMRRWFLLRLKNRLVQQGIHVFVAEEEGEVLGYAVWRRVGQDAEAAKWQQDSLVSFPPQFTSLTVSNGSY
jgi:hypothetical protein